MTNVTEIGIVNSALIKIGAQRINSYADGTKGANLAQEQFPKMRDEVLRAHPWNFAKKRTALAQLAQTPAFEYDFYYQLPSDCLKVLHLQESDIRYKIEGSLLLTNEPSISIAYISQVTDTSLFDSDFAEALACRLAADLAYALVQSTSVAETMMGAYDKVLGEARSMNAQEDTPDVIEATTWLHARF